LFSVLWRRDAPGPDGATKGAMQYGAIRATR
jgi:hypothetical protein